MSVLSGLGSLNCSAIKAGSLFQAGNVLHEVPRQLP